MVLAVLTLALAGSYLLRQILVSAAVFIWVGAQSSAQHAGSCAWVLQRIKYDISIYDIYIYIHVYVCVCVCVCE